MTGGYRQLDRDPRTLARRALRRLRPSDSAQINRAALAHGWCYFAITAGMESVLLAVGVALAVSGSERAQALILVAVVGFATAGRWGWRCVAFQRMLGDARRG